MPGAAYTLWYAAGARAFGAAYAHRAIAASDSNHCAGILRLLAAVAGPASGVAEVARVRDAVERLPVGGIQRAIVMAPVADTRAAPVARIASAGPLLVGPVPRWLARIAAAGTPVVRLPAEGVQSLIGPSHTRHRQAGHHRQRYGHGSGQPSQRAARRCLASSGRAAGTCHKIRHGGRSPLGWCGVLAWIARIVSVPQAVHNRGNTRLLPRTSTRLPRGARPPGTDPAQLALGWPGWCWLPRRTLTGRGGGRPRCCVWHEKSALGREAGRACARCRPRPRALRSAGQRANSAG